MPSLVLIIQFFLFLMRRLKNYMAAVSLTCSMYVQAIYKQLTSIPLREKVKSDFNKTIYYYNNIIFINSGIVLVHKTKKTM